MSSELVLLEKTEHVAEITLNHPQSLNALSFDLAVRLREVVDEVRDDPGVRAVLLTGAGRGFCSGANLLGDSGTSLAGGGMGVRNNVLLMNELLTDIAEMEKPWLAAVNGPAVGGGCSLALICDLALAAESAYLALGYVNVGVVLDMGSTFLLSRLVGLRKAKELAFFGDRVYGAQAAEIGLVNAAAPDDELLETARQWARRLASGPTRAIGAIKLGMQRAQHGTFRDALHWEAMMLALITQTDDAAEGIMAFFQKRKPDFKGK
jgi:2-(1,2-epoxy-1,2-dihydrophenyl)acetyl-CoA isomerase